MSAPGYDVTGKVKFVARLIGGNTKVTAKATIEDGKAVVRLVLPKAWEVELDRDLHR